MSGLTSIRRATAALAMSLILHGCGGAQPAGVPPASGPAAHAATSSGDLLYATGSDSSGAQVFMLSYPQGQLVGSIPVPASGLCSDTNGNVYVLWNNAATEYAHGGTTPLKTLRIPGATMYGCAVDPTTNNVALVFSCPPCQYENLAIFPNGSGPPTRYVAPYAYTCTYDGQGNLFLDSNGSQLSELPSGSQTFATITLNKSIAGPGQVQWDGTYVTLQSIGSPGAIYRIQVSGSSGTVVGETKLARYMRYENDSWISASDGTVVMPFSQHGDQTTQLGVWKYPRGGHATKVIKKIGVGDRGFYSVTVSVAPSAH